MTREQREQAFESAVEFLRRHLLDVDDDVRDAPMSVLDDYRRVEYDGSASLTFSVVRRPGEQGAE